jgi:phosphopantothenoylcysteine decarboxylase/phosphopantothenate--cysteine ligase
MALEGHRVLVGVSGGIACYKVCEVVRLLARAGAHVQVVMTAAARAFVMPLTLQTLSGQRVATDTFDCAQEAEIGHIRIADAAEVALVAPATANVLGKLAHGIADDLLTTVLLATRAPLLLAPAMNVHMWQHPAVQANLATLRARGAHVVGPESGSLACGYEGEGRLADPAAIVDAVGALLGPRDLEGEHVLVSAGPTQEPVDPVRYLSNHSSGKMGVAIAVAARRRGATVTLVTGPTAIPDPPGVDVVHVTSAAEMARALQRAFSHATVLVMAAAVADYRPARPLDRKMKKGSATLVLPLERTSDILTGLAAEKGSRVVVGFAAETHDVVAEARRKLREKRLDLVVANDVTAPGAGFGSDTNVVRLIDASGGDSALPVLPKDAVADRILDWVVGHLPRRAAARRRPTPRRARAARRRSRR